MLTDRIGKIVQQWFLTEPLLFGAWSSHQVVLNDSIHSVRVGRGKIELSPRFCGEIDDSTLREVMKFESLRVILKHPYQRQKPHREYALTASNVSINECIQSMLKMPTAKSTFGDETHDRKHFEYYYNLLAGIVNSPKSSKTKSPSKKTGDCGG